MADERTIHQQLDDAASTVEDVVNAATGDDNDADMDNTIDSVVDAMDEIELDDDDDNTDIDVVAELEDEEIDIEAESEDDAAEIELLSDVDYSHAEDSRELADEIQDSVELNEAYNLIDDELIVAIQEAEE